jgi:hypothetical protein
VQILEDGGIDFQAVIVVENDMFTLLQWRQAVHLPRARSAELDEARRRAGQRIEIDV